MPSIRAHRFQLRLKSSSERQLRRIAGGLRWIWNQALAEHKRRHAAGEKFASYVDMCKWLTTQRHAPTTAWLSEGPIHPQQQVLKRLDEAYKRFFAKAGGFPSFKKRGQEPGIRFPDKKQFNLDAANGRIQVPKLGWLRFRMSQPVAGELRNLSLTREGKKWFVSIQVETNETINSLGVPPTLGIDLGLAAFAATSDGALVEPLKALSKQQVRLRRYQRSVSRKTKGSANRRKAVQKLGDLHRKIAHQRSDWLHKLTTNLADSHPVIALEDLRVKNMSASAKGTAVRPGKNVRQKAGLNRGILDAAWGEFARQLTYKVRWRGGQVILVDSAYTSQSCRICKQTSAENRKTQSVFSCVACGHTENADIHAAKNILARAIAQFEEARKAAGHAASACGEVVRRRRPVKASGAASRKQEPTEARVLV